MNEGDKVTYRDRYGDVHKARICYIFTSVSGKPCAHLNDGTVHTLAKLEILI